MNNTAVKRVRKVIIAMVVGFLLAMLVSTGLAAQGSCPEEIEPNNEYYTGNPIGVPGCVIGTIPVYQGEAGVHGDSDYFVIETTVGYRYTLNLAIDSPQGLNMRMYVYDVDYSRIAMSWASSTWVSVSFVATTDITYICVRHSLSSLPDLPAVAAYRLDVTTVYRVLLPMVRRGH